MKVSFSGHAPGRPGKRWGAAVRRGAASWRAAFAGGVLVLLASCSPQPRDDLEVLLPDVSLLRTFPGCKVESVSPAEALPRESDGNGGFYGGRRAIIRFEAVCLPNLSEPSPWWQPYKISFEQGFRMPPETPGVPREWSVADASPVADRDQPSRAVDSTGEARGKNCAVLLDRIESEALPCVRARSSALAALVQKDLQLYREARLTFNIRGENDLNFVRLARDSDCLARWRERQRELGVATMRCAVD